MSPEYQQYLMDRFAEEVEGESLFRSLSERTVDAGRKSKLQVLAQLERETKEHIRKALQELGVEIYEQRKNVERGEQIAERFSQLPWMESLQILQPALKNFVAQFHAAEKLAVEAGQERTLLRHITRHEEALLAFVVRELEGRPAESLDAVLALLGHSPRDC